MPGWPLRPQRADVVTPDWSVKEDVTSETVVKRNNVWIWVHEGCIPRPIARLIGRNLGLLARERGGDRGNAKGGAKKYSPVHERRAANVEWGGRFHGQNLLLRVLRSKSGPQVVVDGGA